MKKYTPEELSRLLIKSGKKSFTPAKVKRLAAEGGIADGKGRIELEAFAGYLKRRSAPSASEYEKIKARAGARAAAASASGREIGELPQVADEELKERCRNDFRAFCLACFPELFTLKFSPDHEKIIHRIEEAVLRGGLFALAMPRGTGKTTICECACLWAMLYGHREFVALIGATEEAAGEMLESIKISLETSDSLLAMFPEVCWPIRKLDRIANRCAGQLYRGKHTYIRWTDYLVLPTIDGSRASGTTCQTAGITGRVRGMGHKKPDGRKIRPDLVIIDDPQTNESANSAKQTADRLKVVARDVLGLAGPGKKIAGVMPCTVISPDDVADQILNAEIYPDWNGARCKLLYSEPTDAALWEKYAELRAESLRVNHDIREATAFYAQHRAEMDAGALPAWEERYEPDELSAIQYAMDLKIKDPGAFAAEYQNEPLAERKEQPEALTGEILSGKLNRMTPSQLPLEVEKITMMIDLHARLLYYAVIGWSEKFTGYVLDYGTFPDQKRSYYQLADCPVPLERLYPGKGLEAQIYAALEALTALQLDREFVREDGTLMHVSRCLIDANWGQTTETVYQFIRQSRFRERIYPSHGKGVTASMKPMDEYRRERGQKMGLNWYLPSLKGKRQMVRHVIFDANYWKSFVSKRLRTAMGAPGCLSFPGSDARKHQLIFEHLLSETFVETEGRSRRVEEWHVKPGAGDNHYLDCVVGAAVAASIEGIEAPTVPAEKSKKNQIRYVAPPPRRN